jgi:hypothetical protein
MRSNDWDISGSPYHGIDIDTTTMVRASISTRRPAAWGCKDGSVFLGGPEERAVRTVAPGMLNL